ncbi:MAG: hypothetical protein LC687_07395 [Actinobacteria bacterium]|nr:hypothetical protein [Actinomycetota bacterium]
MEGVEILALDPGGTTGVAELYDDDSIRAYNIVGEELELWWLLEYIMPNVIVYERFDYRPHQPNVDLTPVELIGIIKLYSKLHNIEAVPQQQLKGHRGFWTDDKLKALDLYKTGEQGHSNDATRQLLYYVTFTLNQTTFIDRL